MKQTTRIQTAKRSLEITKQGFYLLPSGKKVNIQKLQDYSVENTQFYSAEKLAELIEKQVIKTEFETQFEVINETTLNAVRRLLSEGNEHIMALNFASAKNPGGGFFSGAQAQEESIARATGLYPCLMKEFHHYETHRKMSSCLYTDNMIYSPAVPIFCDEDGDLLEQSQVVSIITSPAVNAGVVRRQEEKNREKILPTMRIRMEKVLALSVERGHKILVLGAWGCGVFQNEPIEIAAIFADFLKGKYKNVFEKIVFAVKSDKPQFIAPFEKHFS
jgi:uncharacterized protein (TIGR02452 family)